MQRDLEVTLRRYRYSEDSSSDEDYSETLNNSKRNKKDNSLRRSPSIKQLFQRRSNKKSSTYSVDTAFGEVSSEDYKQSQRQAPTVKRTSKSNTVTTNGMNARHGSVGSLFIKKSQQRVPMDNQNTIGRCCSTNTTIVPNDVSNYCRNLSSTAKVRKDLSLLFPNLITSTPRRTDDGTPPGSLFELSAHCSDADGNQSSQSEEVTTAEAGEDVCGRSPLTNRNNRAVTSSRQLLSEVRFPCEKDDDDSLYTDENFQNLDNFADNHQPENNGALNERKSQIETNEIGLLPAELGTKRATEAEGNNREDNHFFDEAGNQIDREPALIEGKMRTIVFPTNKTLFYIISAPVIRFKRVKIEINSVDNTYKSSFQSTFH